VSDEPEDDGQGEPEDGPPFDWHKEARRLLDENRPERSGAGTDDPQHEWIDKLAEENAGIVPEAEVRRRYLRAEMRAMESNLRRQTRRFFRRIKETGQWPLDWMDLRDDPLVINDDGTSVKLRVLTDTDLDEAQRYMEHEKRIGDLAYIKTMDGFDLTRKWLKDKGKSTLNDLFEDPPDDGPES
jgi:hypothetical protein